MRLLLLPLLLCIEPLVVDEALEAFEGDVCRAVLRAAYCIRSGFEPEKACGPNMLCAMYLYWLAMAVADDVELDEPVDSSVSESAPLWPL